jgi:hypothetical protein
MLLAGALGAVALAIPASAPAVVSGEFGIQRRAPVAVQVKPPGLLQYHGGPVLTKSDIYAIFWDPAGAYRSDWLRLIDRYFQDVGADSGKLTNIFSVASQYTGPGATRASYNVTFRGAYTDVDAYPASGCSETGEEAICLSDAQIRSELKSFVAANHLPTGMGAVYFLLTPRGVNVCTDIGGKGNCSNSTSGKPSEPNGICGYHSVIEPGSSPVIYGVQPWVAGNAGEIIQQLPLETAAATDDVLACQNASALVEPNQTGNRSAYGDYETGLADLIVNQLSIEQQDISVNPLLNGWYQSGTNAEQQDMCQYTFSPAPEELPNIPETTKALNLNDETMNGHPYYLSWAFNSSDVTSGKGITCWQGTELDPHFTSPNPVNPGDIVGFDAKESSFTLDANPNNLFGHTPSEEPFTAPIYSWQFGDGQAAVGPDLASVYHAYGAPGTYTVTLTVVDSGANVNTFKEQVVVAGATTPAGAGASVSAAASAAGTTGAIAAGSTPIATALVLSHSLRSALKGGLVVRYSVNEPVTGRFEVMIRQSIAKRIGLHLPKATGLAPGTGTQAVVAKAILVTTAGGRGTVKIKFSKAYAARLRKLHGTSLLLRLSVRNRANATATVLVKATLSA